MKGTMANPLPNTNEPASAKYSAMRPSSGQAARAGVTAAASVRFTPPSGSQATAELEAPHLALGGKRTSSVTRGRTEGSVSAPAAVGRKLVVDFGPTLAVGLVRRRAFERARRSRTK